MLVFESLELFQISRDVQGHAPFQVGIGGWQLSKGARMCESKHSRTILNWVEDKRRGRSNINLNIIRRVIASRYPNWLQFLGSSLACSI